MYGESCVQDVLSKTIGYLFIVQHDNFVMYKYN